MEDIDYRTIDVDSLELALNEGNAYLKETIETASLQSKRALLYLNASIGLLVAILGFAISGKANGLVLIESCLSFGILITVLYLSYDAFRSYGVMPLGNDPFNIIRKEKIEEGKSELYKLCLFKCCLTVSESIDFNNESNRVRSKKVALMQTTANFGVVALIMFPLLWSLVCLFLSEF